MPFTIATRNIKSVGILLAKDAQDIYTKNYKFEGI